MRQYSSGNDLIKITATVGDFVLLNALVVFSVYFLPSMDENLVPAYMLKSKSVVLLAANFSLMISEQFFHTIIHRRKQHFFDIVGNVLRLSGLQAVLMFVLLRVVGDPGGLFKLMFIFAVALFLLLLIGRLLEWWGVHILRSRGYNSRTVLLVGCDPAILELYEELTNEGGTGYKVTGYYGDAPMANCPERLTYLGTMDDLKKEMDKTEEAGPLTRPTVSIDELFCCLSHSRSEEIISIMRYCDHNMVHFYYLPRHFGAFRLNMKPELFGNVQIFSNRNEPLSQPLNKIIKRIFDICFSGVVCLLLLPFLPIIALIIKSQSRGPVLFRQQRTGINGKTFTCLKFRSMHVNKDSDTLQATKDDPRKFPFGEFMRKTNIDELPQFFNVLRGDMSVVGPRPHMLHHTEVYGKLIDKYMVRHFCRPGITGWAQVTGSRGETRELWQMEERVKKDIWYIEHWSFWLDIRIIFMTIADVFRKDEQAY